MSQKTIVCHFRDELDPETKKYFYVFNNSLKIIKQK